ncbi:hypothetical protein O6H91_13G091000 [Diphasiastrum complanatum]|uniref:Uncharacterized protein n=1 Tax=Diphasiastrum complanatum TaxID=34168 RepID=A0ACC2BX97_DIPCM|nr:hypothetical protein O6H91_13G091000 [Diphasiastrum complanatum]
MNWEDEAVGADIAAAGRLLSDTISRDLRCFATGELLDALDASRYASHPYSPPPKEWLPFVDVANATELPPVLIERYNAAGGQGIALCGIFPSIRRAWATVDETLFLWRFDKWDGLCPEYSGEEQAICAIGLAKVKPGIFLEAIQYLLVLATPVEIVLLGVCCSMSADGIDPYAEISLQPLPDYTIPTDGVTMTCVSTTENGRIFLGGRDGHVYELLYTTGMRWQSRCRKVCHTGGLGSLLSKWVIPDALKFGAVDSIVEIVIDEERSILYSRTQESKIQVFDLGKHGDASLKKVAEERGLADQRDSRGGGRGLTGRAGVRNNKASIISIATLSTVESKWLHLVAVTSDGRRLYMSTAPMLGGGSQVGLSNGSTGGTHRPSVLRVVTTRPAPTVGTGVNLAFGSLSVGSRSQTDGALKVEAALYSSGAVILSDSSPPAASQLLVATKDYTTPPMSAGNLSIGVGAISGRTLRALRELVTGIGVEGRTLAIADVLPPPEQATAAEASVWDSGSNDATPDPGELVRAKRLWARGDLATQHILSRRRAVVLSTMGVMEIVLNRPVDILQRLFETSVTRTIIEDFFQRFGAGEAAAMCLLLAARLTSDDEKLIPTVVVEKAAEAFEDQRLVGLPQMQGGGATTTVNSTGGGFNMGQVVQEAEPVFSGAHEGLCLCAARLLWSVWELPVFVVKGELGADSSGEATGIVACRLPLEAISTLEEKIRSLEQFLRARRNQRKGHYGRVMGIGDVTGYGERKSIPYGVDSFGRADHIGVATNLFESPHMRRSLDGVGIQGTSQKRQRVPYSPAELAAMEVRGMECIRRLLRRSGEALVLIQLLSQHHLARLAQNLDATTRRQLVQLSFHQLVCSQDGDRIATRLVAALMEYYVSPDGRGTVDDISIKLREGCPSYYHESDYKFYQAVECLERATSARDVEQREALAKEALDSLGNVPETADLLSVCQRFEEIRFYEAVVELPLRKARAVDQNEDAFNEHIDEGRRQVALAARMQCYEVVTNALRSLTSQTIQNGNRPGFGAPSKTVASRQLLHLPEKEKYVRQIVQLSVRWPDSAFHETLYRTMIELGLERELLELAGSDLVPFLQNAGNLQAAKAETRRYRQSTPLSPSVSQPRQPISIEQAKYLELLARFYVHKRQHALAAHVLLRLAERRQVEGGEQITLEQRFEYLSNAVLQARSINHGPGTVGSTSEIADSGLLELLEGKLAVLRFQVKIREELLRISATSEEEAIEKRIGKESVPREASETETLARSAKEKAEELGFELKSITQLYNDYAVRFELWEVCLEILHFSHYSGDTDNSVMRETWARLLDQAIKVGGIGEACAIVKRVGPKLYPGEGGSMPLDSICLHLERAAQERAVSGAEIVGDEDVANALLTACKGAAEPILRTYDKLLASGAILPSPSLRLRILRSVLTVMREWTMSTLSQQMGTSVGTGLSVLGTLPNSDQVASLGEGVRDTLSSVLNRYMTEVRRLALPSAHVETVSRGFKELEEILLGS